MRSDKAPSAGMTSRQKITIAIFAIVFIVVIWQVIGMFRTSTPDTGATSRPAKTMSSNRPNATGGQSGQPTQPGTPQQAQLMPTPNTAQNSPEVMAARAQEQQLQAKYVDAINQLQMLKIERDIAQANQAIMAAKLATVTAQKSIVNLVNPPVPVIPVGTYTKAIGGAASGARPGAPNMGMVDDGTPKEITYRVISVSQVQYKWSAVLGYQGSLYHVQVGDVIPADNSTVVSINRSGVVLSKGGVRKKISLVPVI